MIWAGWKHGLGQALVMTLLVGTAARADTTNTPPMNNFG
jgi:hypothetical protein